MPTDSKHKSNATMFECGVGYSSVYNVRTMCIYIHCSVRTICVFTMRTGFNEKLRHVRKCVQCTYMVAIRYTNWYLQVPICTSDFELDAWGTCALRMYIRNVLKAGFKDIHHRMTPKICEDVFAMSRIWTSLCEWGWYRSNKQARTFGSLCIACRILSHWLNDRRHRSIQGLQ
eukprot:jgi/Botrbrau1/2473/Bobra.0226s0031.1